jgi:cytochrome c-type biogenesis protein
MTNSMQQISLFAAFAAGLLSFVSPCVLPLVPSYISYITGLSLDRLSDASERQRFRKTIMLNSLLFIAGFSTVFIAFGASASLVGQVLIVYQDHIRRIGGVLIIIFGLYLLGILNLKFLTTEKRLHFSTRPAGYVGSYLIGVAFAAGWTPCVGPVLGTILLPLFITALGVDRFLSYFKQVRVYLWGVSTVSGVFLVVVGVMIYANSLTMITSFLERYGIGWYLGQ